MDNAWNRKPRRVGKVLFKEDEKGNTSFDVWDNYGNKIGSGIGFPIGTALLQIIEISYELKAGEMEHLSSSCARQSMVESKEFNEKHGLLKLKGE